MATYQVGKEMAGGFINDNIRSFYEYIRCIVYYRFYLWRLFSDLVTYEARKEMAEGFVK